MKTYLIEEAMAPEIRQRGFFYILSEQGSTRRLYWLGYADVTQTHRRRISKECYMVLYKEFGPLGRERKQHAHKKKAALKPR